MTGQPASEVGAGAGPHERAAADAATIAERTGVEAHDLAVVLGSGWAPAAVHLGTTVAELPMSDLAGFPAPGVAGHAGVVRSVDVGGHPVLVLVGRSHLYEGHGTDAVVHGVRTAVAAGCSAIVLTNAAGGVDPSLPVGRPVLIADHLNLTGSNPLVGPAPPSGPRFVDLTACWSPRLRAIASAVDPTLPEGVYAAFLGPSYETPAEVRMARALGADLVGMSTVLEAIAARQLGVEVLGLSLVTNPGGRRGGGTHRPRRRAGPGQGGRRRPRPPPRRHRGRQRPGGRPVGAEH
jgi:purine-nucleoside phosphorylase